jgi:hypothetical protein
MGTIGYKDGFKGKLHEIRANDNYVWLGLISYGHDGFKSFMI